MRTLALLLLLVNALFFAWSGGWLDSVAGVPAHGDREPDRLARQVRPEAIRVLPAPPAAPTPPADPSPAGSQSGATATSAAGDAAASAALPAPASAPSTRGPAAAASTAAAAPSGLLTAAALPVVATADAVRSPACLQAGPFEPTEVDAAQVALKAALPALRWVDVTVPRGGGWMIYMGRFADRDVQQRKADELRRIAVVFEEIGSPLALGPGLLLGRYGSRAAADAALAMFARRGIRTARVVETAPPAIAHLLRVDRADAQTAAGVAALRLPALRGRAFSACPPPG